jgi:hypothetical protein
MGAFVHAAGVGIVDETGFPNPFQPAHDEVMDDAIPKVGREDLPKLGGGCDKADRAGWPVRTGLQFPGKGHQIPDQVVFEPDGVERTSFPFSAVHIGRMNRFHGQQRTLSAAHGANITAV